MTRLPNIQILRAWAALMIVVHHCGIETARLAAAIGQDKLFDEVPWGTGVPLFFGISGFIMVVTSAHAFGSPSAAFDFMRRRIIRIVPLYWLVTTAALGVVFVAPNLMKAPRGDYFYVLSSYLFWPDTRATGDVRPLATPGWTLNLEMLFYVVFAFALLFPRRVGLSVLFASLGLLVTARVAGVLPGVALNFWGDPIVLGFLFGAAIGIAHQSGLRLPARWALPILGIGAVVLFNSEIPNVAGDGLWPRLANAIPAAVVLIAVALGPQVDESRRVWWPFLVIGDASYSLYLVHEFLLRPLKLAWSKGLFEIVPLWTFVPVGIAISVMVALLTYLLFEKPVTRWLNGVKRRKQASYSAVSVPGSAVFASDSAAPAPGQALN